MKGTTVAIIGGGFCGTLAAIRLLTAGKRGDASLPFGSRIVLIEPTRPGQGLAYRAGPDYWRLNVPAAKMSAFAGRPADFFEWAHARDPQVQPGDYLPRAWYGEYLADRLALAKQRSPRWLKFEHVRARATGLGVDDGLATITLSNGSVIEADRVLLALGNSPTAGPVPDAPDAVADAWNLDWMESLPTYVPRVLLVGTGLTMIDIALDIAEKRPDARVLAISRHGLLPRPHEDAPGKPRGFQCAKAPGARPASSAPAAVSRACRLQRRPRRLASRTAVDTRGHARAVAGGDAADAPALPAAPARLVGRASSSRPALDE